MKNYYFAYGSNLNAVHTQESGFGNSLAKPFATAYLPDRELAFTRLSHKWGGGVLDIRPRIGSIVPGMVIEVDGETVEKLDDKEGHPKHYKRIELDVIQSDGSLLHVFTYEVRPDKREEFVTPSKSYLAVVEEGYEANGLPTKALHLSAVGSANPCALDKIFVYGTLMRREGRHSYAASDDLKAAVLAEAFGVLSVEHDYPRLHLSEGEATGRLVSGELLNYRDGRAPLLELDKIEGFNGFGSTDSLFRRTLVEAGTCDGRHRQAWTYVSDRALNGEPLCNDWREFKGKKRPFYLELVAAHMQDVDEEFVRLKLKELYSDIGYLSIVDALVCGKLSERRLAQCTGKWCVLVG